MRAVIGAFLFIALIALAWAVHAPLGAYWQVRQFYQQNGDSPSAEEALLRAGLSALPALRGGLSSADFATRLHCAKTLAAMGEVDGEDFLLAMLRNHAEPTDPLGRTAEMYLLAAWDRRNGPDDAMRARLREVESKEGHAPETLVVLNECMSRYPLWADGYARRARLYQQGGEVYEARRDAIYALNLAPNHYEALVTLGRVQLAVESPQQAAKCFEHAIAVNPRLKGSLKDELRDTLKAVEIEKEKRREERRKNTPVT